MPTISQLRKKVMHNGSPKRGAIPRIADYLGLSYTAVRYWFVPDQFGRIWDIPYIHRNRIDELMALDLSARKTGPKSKSRSNGTKKPQQ